MTNILAAILAVAFAFGAWLAAPPAAADRLYESCMKRADSAYDSCMYRADGVASRESSCDTRRGTASTRCDIDRQSRQCKQDVAAEYARCMGRAKGDSLDENDCALRRGQ